MPPTVDYHASLDDTLVISSPTGHSKRHEVCPEANKEVIVDRQCGLAVLRGADVYAPGIMAATQGVFKAYYNNCIVFYFSLFWNWNRPHNRTRPQCSDVYMLS